MLRPLQVICQPSRRPVGGERYFPTSSKTHTGASWRPKHQWTNAQAARARAQHRVGAKVAEALVEAGEYWDEATIQIWDEDGECRRSGRLRQPSAGHGNESDRQTVVDASCDATVT